MTTTNAADHIDPAFQRRMDVVVAFAPPTPTERGGIWRLHLPDDHQVPEVLIIELAHRCTMTGGQIRNAVLHAVLLALREGRPGDSPSYRPSGRQRVPEGGCLLAVRSQRSATERVAGAVVPAGDRVTHARAPARRSTGRPEGGRRRSETPAAARSHPAPGRPRVGMPQLKTRVSEPGDPMEREADAVAARATSGASPSGPQRAADEVAQRITDDELQRATEEEVQRTADAELQRTVDEEAQRATDKQVQRTSDNDDDVQRATDDEVQRATDDEVQRATDDEVQRPRDRSRCIGATGDGAHRPHDRPTRVADRRCRRRFAAASNPTSAPTSVGSASTTAPTPPTPPPACARAPSPSATTSSSTAASRRSTCR